MLSLLHIENIAVIERADIEPGKGLTVLTGETGAGKSIIIDSINAILGQRTNRDLIRAGAQKGFVSAVFTDLAPQLLTKIEELDLLGEEQDSLHIQRQISADGKSTCRVNMRPVTVSVLKTLAPYLINIHGQHDGQKLMDEQYHIDFLDSYAGAESLIAQYYPLYQQLSALKRKITALDKSEQERLERVERLQLELQEIEDVNPVSGEDEALTQKKKLFDNAGQMLDAMQEAYCALDGADEDSYGACSLLVQAASSVSAVSEVSPAYKELFERAEEVKYLAQDLLESVIHYRDSIDFSPAQVGIVEERLEALYRLKQKYGDTIADVLTYRDKISQELEALESADETRQLLRREYKEKLAQAKKMANDLTALRCQAARKLEQHIIAELADLDMTRAQFVVEVTTGNKLTARGMDTAAFVISVNPGEPLKPMSKVASGGELSRVMLAMKNVLTAGEPVGTLIFDEIDTGVSGRAAQKIARKLASISRKKQTLCVTHLPQIAAMGDDQLLIRKQVRRDRSYTDVSLLPQEHRADEIARMVSGENITDISRQSARELLLAAQKIKQEENNAGI